MFGTAILDIPRSGVIGPSRTEGLSDALAMSIGRTAAYTLSDQNDRVTVSLESGDILVIGYDAVRHELFIGGLTCDL